MATVKVKVTADTEQADKAIASSQDKAASGYKKLNALAEEGLKSEKLKSGFEGLKKAAELLDPELEKITGSIGKNIKSGFEFAEAGSKIGAAFGPIGIVVVGALGAIAGYFISAARQSAELKKKIDELKNGTEDFLEKFRELDEPTFAQVIPEIDKMREKVFEGGEAAKVARLLLRELLNEGAGTLADSFDKAAIAADRANEATKAILKPVQLTADQARDVINEQIANIKAAKKQIEDESKQIKDAIIGGYANEDILKSQQRLLNKLKDNIAEYSKVQIDAAGQLKKALDKESKDGEERQKKASDAAEKRQEEQGRKYVAYLKENYSQYDKYAEAVAAREIKAYNEQIEWAETVKRVTAEVNAIRVKAAQEVREQEKVAAEERQRNIDEQKRQLEEAFAEQKAGFESVLQPFADVTSAVFGSIQANIEAGKKPLEGFKTAFRSAVGETLKSLGKQWGAQALSELAAGFASLALGPVGGVSASGHFAAAALYGSAAVAAGVGGAVASRSAGAGGASSSSAPAPSSGSGASNPSLGRSSSNSNQGGNVFVTLQGNMFLEGNDRDVARAGSMIGNAIAAGNTAQFLDTGQRRVA